jgi:hypothetical protein
MLKVLYDTANKMDGAAQSEAAAKPLFEDDDEKSTVMGKLFKSGFSLDSPARISPPSHGQVFCVK